ncbi:MAG: hypothetical protein VW683_00475 [Betaproteobacteria bacterium]|jgi:hypothetical protein
MAIKHSKFKNTGILFELLTRQITSDILSGNKQTKAISIAEKYFNENTDLGKELLLYKSFFSKKVMSEHRATEFVQMVCEQRKNLSNKRLAEQKYSLIKEIKENYDLEKFLSHRVGSYKVYASVYKTLEANTQGVTIRNFEDLSEAKATLVEHLSGNVAPKLQEESHLVQTLRNQEESVRLLSYKMLQEKFNQKYQGLSPKQKLLLREYIRNYSDRNALRELFQAEAKNVYTNLQNMLKKVTNKVTEIKLTEVSNQLAELSEVSVVKQNHLTALMIGYEIEKQLTDILQ